MSALLDAVNNNDRTILRQLLTNTEVLIDENNDDFPALRQAAELSENDPHFMQCATLIIHAFDAYNSQDPEEKIEVPTDLRERIAARYKTVTSPSTRSLLTAFNQGLETQKSAHNKTSHDTVFKRMARKLGS